MRGYKLQVIAFGEDNGIKNLSVSFYFMRVRSTVINI